MKAPLAIILTAVVRNGSLSQDLIGNPVSERLVAVDGWVFSRMLMLMFEQKPTYQR
jgi:hypothetical protein